MPPTVIADRYYVLRELGRGGMGVVYQVLHKETSEQYALKVLLAQKATKGDSVERFKRELKLPARIKSEHVVQVFDSGEVIEEAGAPFYVMELLRGCDLRHLIDIKHAFTAQEIVWILRQLAQGLSRAHEIGIVHRDLKPDNIFLHCRDDGGLVVKILDFGIARYALELLETGDKEKLTATQAMLGTPLYMAPEQAKGGEGRAEIGPCTDVWAVGMIVFELLTGDTYWNANSLMAHLGQLLFAPMAPPSQRAKKLPSGFDAWFARACNRDSSKRYQSVDKQVGDLATMLAMVALDSAPPSALFTVVNRQKPPLVDHRDATQISGLRLGSTEQSLRAELFPGHQVQPPTRSSIKHKTRIVLGAMLLLSLGVFALVISARKSTTLSAPSMGATEAGAKLHELALRTDMAAPADLAPSSPPAHRVAVQNRPEASPKRSPKAKSAKSPAPFDERKKAPRTYIPPTL